MNDANANDANSPAAIADPQPEALLGITNEKGRFFAEFSNGTWVTLPSFLEVVTMSAGGYGIRLRNWKQHQHLIRRVPTYVIFAGATKEELRRAVHGFEVIEGVKRELQP